MKLIVGLGNPGREYEKTRHNIGFMVIAALAEQLSIELREVVKWPAEIGETAAKGQKVVLFKPLTYMNDSGSAIGAYVDYYKLDPTKDVWVISDDLDLPLGRVRVRHEGSSGGHRGLQSVIDSLKTNQFTRIRLGIEEFTGNFKETDPKREEPEASLFVLQPFSKREEPLVKETIESAVQFILTGLEKDGLKAETLESGIGPGII